MKWQACCPISIAKNCWAKPDSGKEIFRGFCGTVAPPHSALVSYDGLGGSSSVGKVKCAHHTGQRRVRRHTLRSLSYFWPLTSCFGGREGAKEVFTYGDRLSCTSSSQTSLSLSLSLQPLLKNIFMCCCCGQKGVPPIVREVPNFCSNEILSSGMYTSPEEVTDQNEIQTCLLNVMRITERSHQTCQQLFPSVHFTEQSTPCAVFLWFLGRSCENVTVVPGWHLNPRGAASSG